MRTVHNQAVRVTTNWSRRIEFWPHGRRSVVSLKWRRNVIVMWEKLEVLLKGQALVHGLPLPIYIFAFFFQHCFTLQETPFWSKPQYFHTHKTRQLSSPETGLIICSNSLLKRPLLTFSAKLNMEFGSYKKWGRGRQDRCMDCDLSPTDKPLVLGMSQEPILQYKGDDKIRKTWRYSFFYSTVGTVRAQD